MRGFLFGVAVGIGLGVLFAPMSGERTRSNLAERAGDLADTAREAIDEGRERMRSGLSNLGSASGELPPTGTSGF